MNPLRRAPAGKPVVEATPYDDLSSELRAGIDDAGRLRRLTSTWERILGHRRDELLDRALVDLVHPDDVTGVLSRLRQALESKREKIGFEARLRDSRGEYVSLEWEGRFSSDDGLVHLAGRDLAERRRMASLVERAEERADRASRAESGFMSRMSHELRTPLTSVIGFSELLLKDGLEPQLELKAEQVLKAGRHLLALIDELLDISRVDGGTMTASTEPVQVNGLLRDALALAEPQAAGRDLNVRVDLEASRDVYVMADPQRLRQVILNLLSNAVKYNRPGGEIVLSCETGAESTLRVRIRDTGAGLTDERLARMFVPFDRLGAERTSIEGTGLGLVLSQRLIELMGGRLSAESEVGVGTTFTIELGVAKAPSLEPDETISEPDSNGQGLLSGHSVLIVEDNATNLDLLRELVVGAGARAMTARDGRSGFDLARQQEPSLILLDVHLPDFGGTVMVDALSKDSLTEGIPVIALSADGTRAQKQKLFDHGIVDYVTKPFDGAALVESVQQALARRR
jgi:PAS domain S-box-containing protein